MLFPTPSFKHIANTIVPNNKLISTTRDRTKLCTKFHNKSYYYETNESQRYSKVVLQRGGNPPERVLSHGSLWGKASNSPHSYLHTTVELFAPHIPNPVCGYNLSLRLDRNRHNVRKSSSCV